MVGRRDVRVQEEGKPLGDVFVQMLGKPNVVFVSRRRLRQGTQPLRVIQIMLPTSIIVGILLVELITQLQASSEKVDYLLRKISGRARLLLHQPLRPPQCMVDALLMDHVLLEAVVSGIAIVSHASRPVDANHLFQGIGTAVRTDDIESRSVVSDLGVDPGGLAA